MKARLFRVVVGVLGLGALLTWSAAVRTEEPPPPPDVPPLEKVPEGVEVQGRGPVHEAFAEPVIRGPRATPVVPKQPPEPIAELPPDKKPAGDNVEWIPGYWAWDLDKKDFLWVSGVWRNVPPGRDWVPGHWNQVEDGWQWVAGYWGKQDQKEVNFLPPVPDPVPEAAPVRLSATDVFVPGTWVFQQMRYLWRPGFWMGYQPGWVWNPAYYVWTPAGYVFVDGYWDYPLQTRGLLFAPVAFRQPVWAQPGWSYQPSYIVNPQFLMGALFVRLDYNHYYFGDYFGNTYANQGYVSWVDYRIGQRFYDPLYSYYQVTYRDTPGWSRNLTQLYAARASGELPAPPRTLLQQANVVSHRPATPTNVLTAIQNASPLTSLSRVSPAVVKLRPVTRDQMLAQRKAAQQIQTFGQERARMEARVVSRGSPLSASAPRMPVRVTLPQVRVAARDSGTVKVPQTPLMPRMQPRTNTGGSPFRGPGTPDVRSVPPRGTDALRSAPGIQPRPTSSPRTVTPDPKPGPRPGPSKPGDKK